MVAFICVHNSCRSQMAEALGKIYGSDVFESYSAGTETKPEINFTIFDMLPSNEFDNNDCKLKYGERVANIKSLERVKY